MIKQSLSHYTRIASQSTVTQLSLQIVISMRGGPLRARIYISIVPTAQYWHRADIQHKYLWNTQIREKRPWQFLQQFYSQVFILKVSFLKIKPTHFALLFKALSWLLITSTLQTKLKINERVLPGKLTRIVPYLGVTNPSDSNESYGPLSSEKTVRRL